ncbi:hypothetical protein BJY04DRAFT_43294 [Aspergillus karnatakaensis]|uniref:uncharacterized protein n=1 Tax=Aspergillus karnatakaensis TaxID=1810916 RepID=UPI003CCDC079
MGQVITWPSPNNLFVSLNGPSSNGFQTLSQQDYESAGALIRSLTALHASKHSKLFELLELTFQAKGFPDNLCDSEGCSLLHLASANLSHRAVTFLVQQARSDRLVFEITNVRGQTPLHAAVVAGAKLQPGVDRTPCQEIIKTLLHNISSVNRLDERGLTAWDYVNPKSPIAGWLTTWKRIFGESDGAILKPLIRPNELQETVCRDVRSLTAAFCSTRDGRRKRVFCDEPPVYDLLYDSGPQKLITQSRPVDVGDIMFRWIHLPANNRPWVEDLFAGLALKDSSMDNQQREGFTRPFNYFFAKAEQYTQAKLVYPGMNPDQWPAKPPSDTSKPIKRQQIAVVLFMPILGFETRENLDLLDKQMQAIARGKMVPSDNVQITLAQAYIGHGEQSEHWLHPRRPLDQFSYKSRTEDQVMPTQGQSPDTDHEGAAVLMVDQLWLWILDDGTVLTCFPNECDPREDYNLKVILRRAIKQKNQANTVRSLVDLIIRSSVNFYDRAGPQKATFVSSFQRAINHVAGAETKLSNRFNKSTAKMAHDPISAVERDDLTRSLLEFTAEFDLLMKIRDIQDELNIVKTVVEQQKGVIEQLSRAVEAFYRHSNYAREERKRPFKGDFETESPQKQGYVYLEGEDVRNTEFGEQKGRDILHGSAIATVEDNMRVVIGMLEYAGRIEHAIDHLLDLKQKQANALEARFAREGSEQSRRQGNIMLYWTTITIIFLPMSFLSSLFTINVSEFPKNAQGNTTWPLRSLAAYLFGISFALILPLLLLGFSLRFTPSQLRERMRYKALFNRQQGRS